MTLGSRGRSSTHMGKTMDVVGPVALNNVLKTSPVSSNNMGKLQTAWSGHDPWPPIGKEPPTNTSMDSGVAGLRDTPVHAVAQNNNYCNNKNNAEDYVIPKFIVDHSTRTTYMKGRFLGKGGFARVHEVTDLTTSKTYAGKIIPKCHITKPHHKEKIAREIDVHRHLRHRHVVRFHHYFEDDCNVYIILENCAKRSLVHVLKNRRTLTESEVRYYMAQLVEGVAYVHQQHVIHRDLKLGNMFLTEDMVMKIGDFGLATRVSDNNSVTICGTPNYIAPEVLKKLGHSYEADVWAMGCIMYALLVGQPPFETESLEQTYKRISSNKFVIPPLISESARHMIRRFLHPDPHGRPRLDEVLSHDFFAKGIIPRTLPTSACQVVPHLRLELFGKAMSVPEQSGESVSPVQIDVNKITSSVSTLRIPNAKVASDKINLLDLYTNKPRIMPCVKDKKDSGLGGGGSLTSCLRQKLSAVICASDSKVSSAELGKKRDITSGVLYNLLATCLDNMPDEMNENPPVLNHTPLFISKWIDYSNKYGFGYQLSDHSVGVFFNDLTRICLSTDKSHVEYTDSSGRLSIHQPSAVPAWLAERYQLLSYFGTYMDENLTEAGDVRVSKTGVRLAGIPHVRRWDRTPKSIIMQLSNGTFQINFFKDHTKIVIAGDRADVLVMLIGGDRQSFTYRLAEIAEVGCDGAIRERLVYSLSCLRQYAELDGEDV